MLLEDAKGAERATLEIIERDYASRIRIVQRAIDKAKSERQFEAYVKKDELPHKAVLEYLKRLGYRVNVDGIYLRIEW